MIYSKIFQELLDKIRSSDEGFVLHPEENDAFCIRRNIWFYFHQMRCGNGKLIYCIVSYHDHPQSNWFQLDQSQLFAVCPSDGNIYLAGNGFYELWSVGTPESDLPNGVRLLNAKPAEYNDTFRNKVFPAYYESLPLMDISPDEERKARLLAREVKLDPSATRMLKPTVDDYFTPVCTSALLLGIADFQTESNNILAHRRDADLKHKAMSAKAEEFLYDPALTEAWERELADAIMLYKKQSLLVEFTAGGVTAGCRLKCRSILGCLVKKQRFFSYDAQSRKEWDALNVAFCNQNKVTTYTWASCPFITAVYRGKKLLYKRDPEETSGKV